MSTRGVIARLHPTADFNHGRYHFVGRFHHWDSNPTMLGRNLYNAYRGYFKRNLSRMLEYLISDHPTGWSTINGCDFRLPAKQYTDEQRYKMKKPTKKEQRANPAGGPRIDLSKPIPHGPICHCHHWDTGLLDPECEEDMLTNNPTYNLADSSLEWAYVFDPHIVGYAQFHQMHVLRNATWDNRREGGPTAQDHHWELAATVYLGAPAPNWGEVECGVDYTHCSHVAYYHFPETRDTKSGSLPIGEYLGRVPILMDPGRCAEFIIGEVRYSNSGGGTLGGRGLDGAPTANIWYADLRPVDKPKAPAVRLPVATINPVDNSRAPYEGVTWIFPPTKIRPEGRMVGHIPESLRPARRIRMHRLDVQNIKGGV